MAAFRPELAEQIDGILATLSPDDQEEVLRIIELLCVDPYIDGVRRHMISSATATLSFYDGDEVWVSYRLKNNDTVQIVNCGRYDNRWVPMM